MVTAVAGSSCHCACRSFVLNVTDGLHPRCVSVIANRHNGNPLPVLFDFHGAGGNAQGYGMKSDTLGVRWSKLAETNNFALIGGEATQWTPSNKPGSLTPAGRRVCPRINGW